MRSDVQFELPRMFREPLLRRTSTATVRWRKSDEAWTIESGDVRMTQRRRQRNGALQSRRFPATAPRRCSICRRRAKT